MTRPRVVLLHGAATTARIWRQVAECLDGCEVLTPDRRSTGAMAGEVADVAALCAGAIVAGVSGGATLGLAVVSAGVPVAAAVLHEPAVGSLVPGLLAPVAAAYQAGGVPSFARMLYGPSWQPGDAPSDPEAVARDLAMFRAFEPSPVPEPARVTVTVGEQSPPPRHLAARLLAERFFLRVEVIPAASHAVHMDHPQAFADVIRRAANAAPLTWAPITDPATG